MKSFTTMNPAARVQAWLTWIETKKRNALKILAYRHWEMAKLGIPIDSGIPIPPTGREPGDFFIELLDRRYLFVDNIHRRLDADYPWDTSDDRDFLEWLEHQRSSQHADGREHDGN